MKHLLAKSLLALAACATAQAAITYVDASASNLTLANGSAFTPNATGNVYNDNNWSVRSGAGLASSNTVYEAGGSTNGSLIGEDTPAIKQTVTGLSAGSYDVYAYFWVAYNVRWGLSAGLAESSLTAVSGAGTTTTNFVYSAPDTTTISLANLSDGTFTVAPTQATGGADRVLAQIYLGTAVVGGSGNLEVFIDNQQTVNAGNSPSATNSRGWFDGVGYEAVPEPSAALLGLVGLTALLRRRRA